MTAIQATARAVVTKGHIFQRRRYLMELYIEDIYTGLHWHLTKREANRMAPVALANASALLEHFGAMDSVMAQVNAARNGAPNTLPAKGSKVTLKAELGDWKPGTEGTITDVSWEPEIAMEHQYPLRVAFRHPDDGRTLELPMRLDEVELVK